MKPHWHEQIQRYVNGQSSAEETAALLQALTEDAELRALYLDYINLDAALGAMAHSVPAANVTGRQATGPRPLFHWAPRSWRWIVAAAACAAIVLVVLPSKLREKPRARPDIGTVTAAAHAAVSRLYAEAPPTVPAWMSPTASLLDQPALPKDGPRSPSF
jgi:hypothetical protein